MVDTAAVYTWWRWFACNEGLHALAEWNRIRIKSAHTAKKKQPEIHAEWNMMFANVFSSDQSVQYSQLCAHAVCYRSHQSISCERNRCANRRQFLNTNQRWMLRRASRAQTHTKCELQLNDDIMPAQWLSIISIFQYFSLRLASIRNICQFFQINTNYTCTRRHIHLSPPIPCKHRLYRNALALISHTSSRSRLVNANEFMASPECKWFKVFFRFSPAKWEGHTYRYFIFSFLYVFLLSPSSFHHFHHIHVCLCEICGIWYKRRKKISHSRHRRDEMRDECGGWAKFRMCSNLIEI